MKLNRSVLVVSHTATCFLITCWMQFGIILIITISSLVIQSKLKKKKFYQIFMQVLFRNIKKKDGEKNTIIFLTVIKI